MLKAVLVIVVALGVQSQPPTPRDRPEGQTQQQKAEPKRDVGKPDVAQIQPPIVQVPRAVPEAPIPQAQTQNQFYNSSQQGGWDIASVVSALAAVVMAVLTFMLYRLGQRQWLTLENQKTTMIEGLAESRKAANAAVTAADAANVNAEAAKSSARTAQKTLYLTLRARLGLRTLTIRDFGKGLVPSFVFVFHNYGGKTALVKDYYISLRTIPLLAEPPNPPDLEWKRIDFPLHADSDWTVDLVLDMPMSESTWTDVSDPNGVNRFSVFGAVRYDDGFGKRRIIRFCRQYEPDLSKRRKEVAFGIVRASGYNYAD